MEQPTKRQMEILLILNPFEYNRNYKDAAEILGVSESCVKNQMFKLKKQCPVIYEKFRKIKLVMEKELNYSIYQPVIPFSSFRKERHKTSMSTRDKPCKCGIKIPEGQDECYMCWRRKDKKKNPKLYEKDRMFPANGRTPSTIEPIVRHRKIDDFTVDDLPVAEPLIDEKEKK